MYVASFPGLPPHARNVTRIKIAKLGVTLRALGLAIFLRVTLRACGGRPGNEANMYVYITLYY